MQKKSLRRQPTSERLEYALTGPPLVLTVGVQSFQPQVSTDYLLRQTLDFLFQYAVFIFLS